MRLRHSAIRGGSLAAALALCSASGLLTRAHAQSGSSDACPLTVAACRFDGHSFEEPQGDPAPAAVRDEQPRSSFLRWLHTDVLWISGQSNADVLGLIGVHLAVARVGRVDFYGPPGVMLIRQPTVRGPILRPALTWGVSYRFGNVYLPGRQTPIAIFGNAARCWTSGSAQSGYSLFGLSITWVP
jgi:hypothetical protein